jgi:hypothetical protein
MRSFLSALFAVKGHVMPRHSQRQFHRGDRVRLRVPYGSYPAGATGVVVEVFWSAEQCSVAFSDTSIIILPWRLLEPVNGAHKSETQ